MTEAVTKTELWDVRDTLAFRDHHRYSRGDARAIADRMSAADARVVVTTEKDAVRLDTLGALPFTWRAVPLTLELDHGDTLFATLEAALGRARGVA